MSPADVSLRAWQSLTQEEQAQVLALKVDDQQLEYAGTVERTIETCTSSHATEVAGLAILLGETVVGFLVLRRGPKLPDWAPLGSVALAGMRIDRTHQGASLGRRALIAVDAWLWTNWPEVETLALSVDAENLAGRAAYRNAGFSEFMEPRPGRIGTVHFLAKHLRSTSSAA
jgi:RimJ/RimL family protein N-acetyltransferase